MHAAPAGIRRTRAGGSPDTGTPEKVSSRGGEGKREVRTRGRAGGCRPVLASSRVRRGYCRQSVRAEGRPVQMKQSVYWPPGRPPIVVAVYLTEASADEAARNAAVAQVAHAVTGAG